jgi:hypothetical protein
VRITFTKSRAGGIGWVALRSDHTTVSLAHAGGPQPGLPHDLQHYVVESALGMDRSFWGCLAAGGSLRTTTATRRKGKPTGGRGLLRRHASTLNAAESAIRAAQHGWKRGDTTPVTAALDAMQTRWDAVPPGGSLALTWPPTGTARRRAGAP